MNMFTVSYTVAFYVHLGLSYVQVVCYNASKHFIIWYFVKKNVSFKSRLVGHPVERHTYKKNFFLATLVVNQTEK